MISPPSSPPAPASPSYFHSLDILRGLAALAVVLFHWQHFLSLGPDPALQSMPLFSYLKPIYLEGWRGVDFFFCLSGFIFYWLYSEKVAAGLIDWKTFLLLRMSRLYPLHLLTLFVVAFGQFLMTSLQGSAFQCQNNDARHFLLHLFFASNWGWELGLGLSPAGQTGFSFNIPAWSVSVEVLLYAIFFFLCLCRLRQGWLLLILMAVGFFLLPELRLVNVGRGVFSFFAGGITFKIFHLCRRTVWPRYSLALLAGLCLSLWILVPLNLQHGWLYQGYRSSSLPQLFTFLGKDAGGFFLLLFSNHTWEILLFPLTILTLALIESHRGAMSGPLVFLGEISYSIYMWHFPLQLAVALVVVGFGISSSIFSSPVFLVGFFIALIFLSIVSFKRFERPLQGWLRARFLPQAHQFPGNIS